MESRASVGAPPESSPAPLFGSSPSLTWARTHTEDTRVHVGMKGSRCFSRNNRARYSSGSTRSSTTKTKSLRGHHKNHSHHSHLRKCHVIPPEQTNVYSSVRKVKFTLRCKDKMMSRFSCFHRNVLCLKMCPWLQD